MGEGEKLDINITMHFSLSPEEYSSIDTLVSPEVNKPIISIDELKALCEDDEDLKEILQDMIKSCLKYTITIAEWKDAQEKDAGQHTDEFHDMDKLRTQDHDAAIRDINIFSRLLRQKGKDNSFMDKGGMDGKNRAAYWKFAVTLSLSRI